MQIVVSSLAMSGVADEGEEGRIRLFRRIFLFHGALGHRQVEADVCSFSELHRLLVVPLIFKLLPIKALTRKKPDELVKPYVNEHLRMLGVFADDKLVSIIKSVADQYYVSYVRRHDLGVRYGLKKKGISDLRAGNPDVYRKLLAAQRSRCALCGVLFSGSREQTLDHVIPWHLVGDVDDGANWQILCEACNLGKREWFSSLQSAQATNWVYSLQNGIIETPTRETRYVALATARQCSAPGCKHTAQTSNLEVLRKLKSGLAIADNVRVLCEEHRLDPQMVG